MRVPVREGMNLTPQLSPLAKRLQRYYPIRSEDLLYFETLVSTETTFLKEHVILRRGVPKERFLSIQSGWAVRCRYTRAGNRQIIHVLLPGDLITPDLLVTRSTDHEVTSVTDVVVRAFDRSTMTQALADTPSIAAGLWWCTAQEDGMLREQIVRLGRRAAMQRVPHLLLELNRRLQLVDEATDREMTLPLTQRDIADALGLSAVHVSRTLKALVADGYIRYAGKHIEFPDPERLADMCDFDVVHLHLDVTPPNPAIDEDVLPAE